MESLTFCQLKKGKIKLPLPTPSFQFCHWLQRARTRLITCILVLMCRELDATVMRAIASLLSGLPLQPEGMETDLDLAEAKSQLFLKLVKSVKICFLYVIKDLLTFILQWRPASSEKIAFFTNSSFWTGFCLITTRIAKNEFCNKKGIFSDQSYIIKQLFCFSHMRMFFGVSFSLSFFCFAFLVYMEFCCPLYLLPFAWNWYRLTF